MQRENRHAMFNIACAVAGSRHSPWKSDQDFGFDKLRYTSEDLPTVHGPKSIDIGYWHVTGNQNDLVALFNVPVASASNIESK